MLNADLTCELLGMQLRNPVILASGIWGTSTSLLERAALSGAAAVTAKSCSYQARDGHPNPVTIDWQHGLINAIGLSNPGVYREVALLMDARQRLDPLGVPVFASIFGGTVAEYEEVAQIIAGAKPHLVEVNISCPNVGHEFGVPFSGSADTAAEVTEAVRRGVGSIPISIKLSPNVPDIVRIGEAVVEAGADAITAINTMPGMLVDADAGVPVLHNRMGGISGAALKPIALRCVYILAQSLKVPIIGTGGILCGRDAAEMLTAGAAVVGVGSVVSSRGASAFKNIVEELGTWMDLRGFGSLAEVRGRAIRI
ncbi:MAG: dihydroorotate dehydrogenase [Anaerolineae bacterium]|nr:dihydroorotate dehydrogenase [Anaerolineae bacterium]